MLAVVERTVSHATSDSLLLYRCRCQLQERAQRARGPVASTSLYSSGDVIKDGDQSTSGPDDVVGADPAGLAEFRGATEDDLGRDARTNGAKTPRVGRRGLLTFIIYE